MSRCPFGQGFDFTDPDLLLAGMPVSEFAELRKTAPVWWNEQPAGSTTTRRRTHGRRETHHSTDSMATRCSACTAR